MNVNWDAIKYVVLALLSAGGALSIKAMFSGVDLWRSGTARTEARGIANLERMRQEAEYATLVAVHRMEFYRDELDPFLRRQVAVLEGIIIRSLGEDRLPPAQREPEMRPIPQRPREIQEKVKGDVDA